MNTAEQNESLQASLEAARRIGASVDEVRKIHDLIKKQPPPTNVRGFELRFGKDSTGDNAIWIRFFVEDEKTPNPRQISQLTDFGNIIRSQLLGADIHYWPYVEFRAAS